MFTKLNSKNEMNTDLHGSCERFSCTSWHFSIPAACRVRRFVKWSQRFYLSTWVHPCQLLQVMLKSEQNILGSVPIYRKRTRRFCVHRKISDNKLTPVFIEVHVWSPNLFLWNFFLFVVSSCSCWPHHQLRTQNPSPRWRPTRHNTATQPLVCADCFRASGRALQQTALHTYHTVLQAFQFYLDSFDLANAWGVTKGKQNKLLGVYPEKTHNFSQSTAQIRSISSHIISCLRQTRQTGSLTRLLSTQSFLMSIFLFPINIVVTMFPPRLKAFEIYDWRTQGNQGKCCEELVCWCGVIACSKHAIDRMIDV